MLHVFVHTCVSLCWLLLGMTSLATQGGQWLSFAFAVLDCSKAESLAGAVKALCRITKLPDVMDPLTAVAKMLVT